MGGGVVCGGLDFLIPRVNLAATIFTVFKPYFMYICVIHQGVKLSSLPKFESHIQQARHNLRFLEKIKYDLGFEKVSIITQQLKNDGTLAFFEIK